MEFHNEDEAIAVLNNGQTYYVNREDAIRYLAYRPSPRAIKELVCALQDDDFGVRWEAAASLAILGDRALPELLKALTDPDRVGDPRVREGAYHILHYNRTPHLPVPTAKLMEALKGPAPDITSMEVADNLLKQLEIKEAE
jgi:HEAT repeat protein